MARRLTPHEKAARTKRAKKKPVRAKRRPGQREPSIKEVVFLPDCPQQVRAIAMSGASDDEMAILFGIDPELLQKWKEFYPKFEEAIEQGRTMADAEVVQALHKKAVGYTRTRDIAKPVGRGADMHLDVVTIEEEVEPDTQAIKFWLQNRDGERWNRASTNVSLGGKKDAPAIGFKSETKMELMSSILSLVSPKSDG